MKSKEAMKFFKPETKPNQKPIDKSPSPNPVERSPPMNKNAKLKKKLLDDE